MSNRHSQSTVLTSAINQRGSAIASGIGLLLLFTVSIVWLAHAQQPQPTPAEAIKTTDGPIIPRGKGDQCVADTALMRTDHMDLLNHQRDETVIQGIRNKPFSLVDCVNCHAQTTAEGTPIRIDAEGQFCQSCHAYAAVRIDCFTCHAAVPEQGQDQAQMNGQTDEQASIADPEERSKYAVNVADHRQHSMLAIPVSSPLSHRQTDFRASQQ